MASAVRTFRQALTQSTPVTASSLRPATRSARHPPTQQVFRSSRRGYSSETGQQKFPTGIFWGVGGVAALGGGAYYYLNSSATIDPGEAKLSFFNPTKEDYQKVYNHIAHLLVEKDDYDDGSYGPVLVRLAWHCSGTYDAETGTGGSNGATMRFAPEGDHGANAGLKHARDFLQPVKGRFTIPAEIQEIVLKARTEKFPWITYSDLWTLAGVCAMQEMQGPIIPWRPGRTDRDVSFCTPDGRLPDASKGQDHIRAIFGRMGFDDREMVALSGAHALGRCHPDRSGFDGPWDFSPTVMTNEYFVLLMNEKWSWRKWNGPKQYSDESSKTLVMLPTDMQVPRLRLFTSQLTCSRALIKDKDFKKHVERYAKDSQVFFKEFSDVMVKLLELGVPFVSKPEERLTFQPAE